MSDIITVTMNPSIDKTVTVDRLVPYGLNRVTSARLDAGGKGINVAKVLRGFQTDALISGLVAGTQGSLLESFLARDGLRYEFLRAEGETRTNLKVVDTAAAQTTEINESGFAVDADTLERYTVLFARQLAQASLAVLSGSLPPGVPSGFYAHCIETAKRSGIPAVLDASGEALRAGIGAIPYAVKPNLEELEVLTGKTLATKCAVLSAARELLAAGIKLVIVSMGADGAVVADAEEAFFTAPWRCDVKSTVGAGDAMVGALAFGIRHGLSLCEIAALTTTAGTVTATKEGTQVCGLAEVMDCKARVTLEQPPDGFGQ
ncbi:MAG: 1-phosphofructokinase [Oscillospiraceae bacterium]